MAKFGFQKKQKPPILALLTDFGVRDSYVGIMKGVIYSICEDARIVDLTHNVGHQDVTGAAFILRASFEYFPQGTIFVCVVDPGVGSDRDIVCVRSQNRLFLAPDNGLLSVIGSEYRFDMVRTVSNKELFLSEISRTFHGRDIFAPVAAHLACGSDVESVGDNRRHLKDLRLPHPVKTTGGILKGEIIYEDQFGNLITNIGEATLQTNLPGPVESLCVSIAGKKIQGISESYSQAGEGELLALIGSSGYLELAVNGGSAKRFLNAGRGSEVILQS